MSKEKGIILSILEGPKREKAVLEKIESIFFKERNKFVKVVYTNNIYNFYKFLTERDYFNEEEEKEEFEILHELEEFKKKHDENLEELNDLDIDDITEVYLFFDYDIHDSAAKDSKVEEMIGFFQDELTEGKLYISYPMVESIIDYPLETYESCFTSCFAKSEKLFKNKISKQDRRDNIQIYRVDDFEKIIQYNFRKASCLLNNKYRFHLKDNLGDYNQTNIHEKQKEIKEKYDHVMILSAFPFFLKDYFGINKIFEIFEEKYKKIDHLKDGNEIHKKIYDTLKNLEIMEYLKEYTPLLTGTIPINISVENKKVSIACCVSDFDKFEKDVIFKYGELDQWEVRKSDDNIVIAFFSDDVEIEIFGQDKPSEEQSAFRYMLVEAKLLGLGGKEFRDQIIELKKDGLKTELAFCKVLGVSEDPYEAMLNQKEMISLLYND